MPSDAPATAETVILDDELAPPSHAPLAPALPGYEVLDLVAVGGMGELWRVHDPSLDRTAVMKVLRPEFTGHTGATARFLAEAQATAQLDHPAIVPVHEVGTLDDGRPYFTMRLVRGRTLLEAIAALHADPEAAAAGGLQRMVQHFGVICDAVAHAHARGVLHRDLKPENVMVGGFGEVQVMDWGLAKVQGRSDGDLLGVNLPARSHVQTQVGTIFGTPAYMPPEQAAGDLSLVDARSDVYSLGAVLYTLLAGRPPFDGPDTVAVLAKVRSGERPAPIQGQLPLPRALVDLCERAMQPDPEARYPDAAALTADVHAYLDGATRRAQARALLDSALARRADVQARRVEAARLRSAGERALQAVGPLAGEEQKASGWALEDAAAALERRAALDDAAIDAGLRAALGQAPDLVEARLALVARRRSQLEEAERRGDLDAAAQAEAGVQRHLDLLPAGHPERHRSTLWLRGEGTVSLVTDPPGAEVSCLRYEPVNRRLVARPFQELGPTPLADVPLPMGRYLLIVRHPACEPVRYPVHIARSTRWAGVPPGGREPHVLRLPRPGELGEHDCLVPGGWAILGGDTATSRGFERRRAWVPGFVIRRFPVTLTELLARLNALVAQGRVERALELAIRERATTQGELGSLLLGRTASGGFELVPDADGDLWDPRWPAIMVSWTAAKGLAAEEAAATGLPWRLPTAAEREKAARGVDGRDYPWGDVFDPMWSRNARSAAERFPARPGGQPADESPYGVRDVAGNVRDWVEDAWLPPGGGDGTQDHLCMGGSWGLPALHCRADISSALPPSAAYGDLAFRLARDWPG